MKHLCLYCIASLWLGSLLQGQDLSPPESREAEEEPSKLDAGNFLGENNRDSVKIEMPINRGDMTITESYQAEAQTTADLGARYHIVEIDENLSEALKNDAVLWSQSKLKDSKKTQRSLKRSLTMSSIIVAVLGLLIFLLVVIPIWVKRR